MSNKTSPGLVAEDMHWAFTTLSHLDTWCGATCHTVLRYVLRCLLVFALTGTFVAFFVRSIDPKRRAELKRRIGADSASSLLEKREPDSVVATFGTTDLSVQRGRGATVLSGGPDVKDSCAVM
jgi:hypothetical protein